MKASEVYPLLTPSEQEAFWTRAKPGVNGCLEWQRELNAKGYAKYNVPHRLAKKDRVQHAHRLAYMIAYGTFDDALHVCHRCDNPKCVRPEHLFLGTNKDNIQDSVRKGRKPRKLTSEQVAQIREEVWVQNVEFARKFGVSPSHVCRIRKGLKRRQG